jgi:WD40 repeat protein
MIAAGRDADRMRTLSDREWEAATGILVAGGRWDELWRLATQAPPVWGVLMLRELAGRAWRPEGEADRGGFHRLTRLARECGDFTRGPVTVESTVLTGHENEVRCLAVTPDGSLLASGGLDGAVRLWRLPSGEPAGVLTGHEGEVREHPARDDMPRPVGPGVYQMVMTPDGGLLATADHRGHVRLWRLPSGEPAGVLTGPGYGVDCLAVTPDGGLLVSGDMRLWRLPAGEPAGWLTGHGGSVRCLAVTPDGALLASGSSFDGAVRLWRLPSGEPAGVLKDRKDIEVWCLAVTPDGWLLASGELGRDLSYERAVRLWHLPSGKPAGVLTWRGGAVSCLAVTPDGGLLVSGEYSGAVRLWRLPSGEPAGVLTGHERDVKHLAVAPDGGLLASGDYGGTVRLWHLPSGESAGVVTAHEGWTSDLVVSPDGTVLASASSDGTVRLSRPVVWAACRTPVGAVDLAAVERVRDGGSSGHERAWATMISELVRWRRRYDIEIGQAPYAAGPTEIEVGE